MKKARVHSRILMVIPFLIAASILAIALNVHQVRADTATITFAVSGVGPDFTDTVININGTDYTASNIPNPFTEDIGSVLSFSFASPLNTSSGVQYLWDNTTGLSNLQSDSLTVTLDGSVTGNYKAQYYLTVNSDHDTPGGAGWYDSGSPAYATLTDGTVSGGAGIQYVFTSWGTDASGTSYVQSNAITMNGPETATANWKAQYYLTVNSAYDSPTPGSGWFDSGSGITESVTSPVSGGSGTQDVCTGWTGTGSVPASGSGLSSDFTIISVSTITWHWKTQYQVTFDKTGVGGDFSGTILQVDIFDYTASNLPVSSWWDSGSSHSFSFASPLAVGSKQYAWSSTSGLSTLKTDTLTATTSGNVVGNYVIQNQVTFDQVGVSSDFASTVVIIDSVSYSKAQLPVSFPWTINSIHSFAFQSPLTIGVSFKQYLWTGTTGLSSLQAGSITVSSYGSIVGNYKTQYYLTVTTLYDSPTYRSGWYDSASLITESVTSPTSYGLGIQRICTGWTGTGDVPSSGTGTSVAFTLNDASTITWNWKTQYLLTVTSSNGSPSPLSGWFDSGSSITESINSPIAVGTGTQYACTGWSGTGDAPSSGSSTSTTFTINSPSAITWNWITQYQLVLSTNFGTTSPSGTNWVPAGSNVTISASPPSTVSGERYVLDGWTGSGTGSFTGSTASPTITMNGPINEIASLTHQYSLTVSSSHGTPAPNSEWVNDGTQINETLLGSPSTGSTGTQYVCMGWSGTGSAPASGSTISVTFTINVSSSITWNWKTQYHLTVSSAHSSATGEGWYDSGSTTYATLAVGTVSDSPDIQYGFVDWTGDASGSDLNSSSIIMNTPKTATAEWKTRYYLTVTSAYSTPSGAGWYDSGSVTYAHLDNGTNSETSDIRHIFIDWSGDASGTVYSQSNDITMNGPKTATADWTVARYALTILSPYGFLGGSTSPSAGVYPKNESSPVEVTATADVGYTFEYWVLDGQNVTGNPISVSMDTDKTLMPVFQLLNFTLTILPSNNGATNPATGTYSYSYGTNVTITASPSAGYEFDHWIFDDTIVSTNPINVTINENHTLQPFFQTAPSASIISPQLAMYLTIFAIVAAVFLVVFVIFVVIERRR